MRKSLYKLMIIMIILFTAALQSLIAQENLSGFNNIDDYHKKSNNLIHKFGIDIRPGYVFPTNIFFKGDNAKNAPINTTVSTHLKYSFQFGKDTFYGRNYPNTSQGIGLGYNTFFNKSEIGNPVALYVFQNSRICSLSENLSLDYEWNFGVSAGWSKYDENYNEFNRVVGSDFNAYINLGLMFNWKISSEWNLTAGVGLNHFSNGNTKYPNAGVNTIEGKIGIIKTRGDNIQGNKYIQKNKFKSYICYDVIIYGATKKKGIFPVNEERPFLVPGSFGIIGMNFNPMYNFSRYFRGGLSLDIQYDESANIQDHIASDAVTAAQIKFYRPSLREQLAAGVSIRGEIVMPIFSINVGIGKNVICKGEDLNNLYQIFVLKTHITKNVFLHVGYQLYKFKDPNNLMLGIGYRFNGKK